VSIPQASGSNEVGEMICPQCRSEIVDEDWNCPSCRINVYWAQQHFEELAGVRGRGGLQPPSTPAFLVSCSKQAFSERAERLKNADGKMREIARRAMRGERKP
jgi:rubredoxin